MYRRLGGGEQWQRPDNIWDEEAIEHDPIIDVVGKSTN